MSQTHLNFGRNLIVLSKLNFGPHKTKMQAMLYMLFFSYKVLGSVKKKKKDRDGDPSTPSI